MKCHFFICFGEQLIKEIIELIREIWIAEEMPLEWRKAVILPIYKKRDTADCGNYQGIALLDVTYKVLAMLKKG